MSMHLDHSLRRICRSAVSSQKGFIGQQFKTSSFVTQKVRSFSTATIEEIQTPSYSIKGEAFSGRAAYLDFQATTPMDPRVLDAMLPFMTELYGNPHSRTHTYGWETESAVEEARGNIADLIGASSKEIIFTSGATESNNMSIKVGLLYLFSFFLLFVCTYLLLWQ